MIRIELPESAELRCAQEGGVLALLDAALVVAEQALRAEHPAIDPGFPLDASELPSDTITAILLIRRMYDLRRLLSLYAAAARNPPDYEDLPF